jgi:hypothetical protein
MNGFALLFVEGRMLPAMYSFNPRLSFSLLATWRSLEA